MIPQMRRSMQFYALRDIIALCNRLHLRLYKQMLCQRVAGWFLGIFSRSEKLA